MTSTTPRLVALIALLALSMAAMPSHAQVETVRTPLTRPAAQAQILGSKYRVQADRAADLALRGKQSEAMASLRPVIVFCDGLVEAGYALVSVANELEYNAYVSASGTGAPIDWVDMACPSAYKTQAFLDIDNKDTDAAHSALDKTVRLAPFWAEPLAERGYLLNQLGKHREALEDYQHALELVARFQSNKYAEALVLRGLGYTEVELGDLDAAEQAYDKSLKAEPDNALALRELDYIRKQRKP